MNQVKYKVEMIDICKSFGGVHALKNVCLNIKPGEILAIVGENGAGKSTLMKILSGAYERDSGTIKIDGEPVTINNPHEGRKLRIGVIYQELSLAPDLTVAENIFLSRLSKKNGLIQWSQLYAEAEELIQRLGFAIPVKKKVGQLSVAYQQVVEIAKSLSENTNVLILDEPTTVLTPLESDKLFETLDNLKQQGVSIVYISHRLEEIYRLADRITVFKDGMVTGTVSPSEVNKDQLIAMMIGRDLSTLFPQRQNAIGKEILRVENVTRGEDVQNISFSLRSGEVLGIAGLVGSGRTELARIIFGADQKDSGQVILDGKPINAKSPFDAVNVGIGLVPESRKEHGVLLEQSVKINITISNVKKIRRLFGFINQKEDQAIAHKMVERLRIKTSGIDAMVMNMSGGNQQKVAIAKWYNADCKVVIFDEPTRGVDVGAKVEIYHLINEMAASGLGIILISSEMTEVIGMSDRVMVMKEGRISGVLPKDEVSETNIMKLAIGG